ncbi:MAG TPA: hypothetical protein VE465_21760 [Streptosporangiaceae bacterium]|nr:hypothetical protein [Streptosporangiaceae bacterium]
MGVDDTGGGVEAVEDQQPADRPPPPRPPPDQPGAEPEGVPSRADSRAAAAAAAANKPDTTQPVEDTPGVESSESNESIDDSTAPAWQDVSSDSGEHDAATELSSTDEQPVARDVETDPLDGPSATAAFDSGAEQPSSTLTTSPTDDTLVDDERLLGQATTTPEIIDHPVPTDVDETATPPHAEDSRPFDDPGNEPEGVPSRADSRASAAAANGELTDKPTIDNTGGPPEQAHGTAPAPETPSAPAEAYPATNDEAVDKPTVGNTHVPQEQRNDTVLAAEFRSALADAHPDTTSRTGEAPEAEPVDQTAKRRADDWPWADEFAARCDARENAATNAEQTGQPPADNTASALSDTHDSTPGAQNPSGPGAESDQPCANDGAETTDGAENATEASDKKERSGTEFMVGDKLVRILDDLYPGGGDIDSDGSVDVEPQPAGDRIRENDELSRFEKFRRKSYEKADDIQDITKKNLDTAQDLFSPPPTGHSETRTGPEASQAPREGVHAGDTAIALMTAGIVIGELIRWGYGKLARRKEVDDARNR